MRNFKKFLIFLIPVLLLIFYNHPIFAASPSPAETASQSDEFPGVDLTIQDVLNIVTRFACWLISASLVIMVIALLWSGIRFFKAMKIVGGDDKPKEINIAKRNFGWTLVGISIILSTNVIIATIANALGGDYSYLPLKCTTSTFSNRCRDSNDCLPDLGVQKIMVRTLVFVLSNKNK